MREKDAGAILQELQNRSISHPLSHKSQSKRSSKRGSNDSGNVLESETDSSDICDSSDEEDSDAYNSSKMITVRNVDESRANAAIRSASIEESRFVGSKPPWWQSKS